MFGRFGRILRRIRKPGSDERPAVAAGRYSRGTDGDRRKLDREILRLALPALGALTAEPIYVLVDTAVVGNLGTEQLAGLALASQILLSVHALFIFLAYGTTSMVARLNGAGRSDEAAQWGIGGIWLAAGVGSLLAGVIFATGERLLELLGGSGEVLSQARIYLFVSLPGLPAMLIALAGVGYLRGKLDTVRPLRAAVITAAGNLALEAVLIYGFGLGIGASALSTVLAQWTAAAMYVYWILKGVRKERVRFGLSLSLLRKMARVGVDLMARTVVLRGAFVASAAVAARIGTADLAAHQITLELFMFTSLLLDALAIAAQSIVGSRLGMGDASGARAAGSRIVQWGLAMGVATALLAVALRPVLPHLFSGDPSVVHLTGFLLWHLAAMLPVCGVVFALDGVLIGAGDLRYLAWAMAASAAILAPLLAIVGVGGSGIGWLWGAFSTFMLGRLFTLLFRFAGNRWERLGSLSR